MPCLLCRVSLPWGTHRMSMGATQGLSCTMCSREINELNGREPGDRSPFTPTCIPTTLSNMCTDTDVSPTTFGQVRTNLMWALGYNAVAIPVAAGVFLPGWGLMLSPAMAGAIMSCSSVAVVTNSLLLRRALKRKLTPPAVREKRQQ